MIQTIAQKKIEIESIKNRAASKFYESGTPGLKEIEIEEFPYRLLVSRREKEFEEDVYYSYHISPEIIDGVRNHGGSGKPNTLEGQVVWYSDNIAYLSQDIDDLFYSHILRKPQDYTTYGEFSILSFTKEDKKNERKTDKGRKMGGH